MVFAALGCDRERDSAVASPTSAVAPKQTPAPLPGPAAAAQPADTVAVIAPRALAVDDRLPPLSTLAPNGAKDCGTCRAGQGPRLVIIGSTEGITHGEAWRDLDAIARLYADNGLGALAVITAFADGRAIIPTDAPGVAEQAARARKQQRITMPVEVALGDPTAAGRGFAEAPPITHDPTVVLIDGNDTVRWIGEVGPHWRELDVAIIGALATALPPVSRVSAP